MNILGVLNLFPGLFEVLLMRRPVTEPHSPWLESTALKLRDEKSSMRMCQILAPGKLLQLTQNLI